MLMMVWHNNQHKTNEQKKLTSVQRFLVMNRQVGQCKVFV